jgi:hypothetical protein
MASTYVNDLRLNEMATGDQSGSWGTVTNTNLELIGDALGYGTQQVFGSDANATTTVADGAADPARAMYFKVTSAGNLTATRTMTVDPDTVSRLMFIENATSGSQSIAVKQGSGAGAAVTIPTGQTKAVILPGSGSGSIVLDAFAALSVVDLLVDDDLTVTDDVAIGGLATVGGTLAVTGVVTANAGVVVDNITIDGTEIDLSSGDLTIDVAGDINLNADGGEIFFKDGSASTGKIRMDDGDLQIRSLISDKNITLEGNDGGSIFTALTLDMSEAGTAIFNSHITLNDDKQIFWGNGTTGIQGDAANGELTFFTSNATTYTIPSDGALFSTTLGTSNLRFGLNAGDAIASGGNYNVLIGDEAGTAITTEDNNVAVGYSAGALLTSSNNVLIGNEAGASLAAGAGNVAIGSQALQNEDGHGENVAIGFRALQDLNGAAEGNNVAVGYKAGLNAATSLFSTYVGSLAGGLGVITGNTNTAVGYIAGYDLTSGNANVLVGGFAGTNLTTGQDNVAIGTSALDVDVDGNNSVAIGRNALGSQTGTDADMHNTAVGFEAGKGSTIGKFNTFIGSTSGGSGVTTGTHNNGVGVETLYALTSGVENNIFGYQAGSKITTGDFNVAMGHEALETEDTGSASVAIGHRALKIQNNDALNYNVAVGYQAGLAVATGTVNTYIGALSGSGNSVGHNNVAVGTNALLADSHGSQSTAVGVGALQTQDNGTTATNFRNSAIGYNAGLGITLGVENSLSGARAGESLTEGNYNVMLGYLAGGYSTDTTTGSKNTILGSYCHTSATDSENQIVMGHDVQGNGDNTLCFGVSSTDSSIAFGATSITAPSDERYKEDIADATAGLSFIKDLRPVTFKWKKEKDIPSDHRAYVEDSNDRVMQSQGETNHGFIAQEVKAAIDAHSEIKDGFEMWSADPTDGRQRLGPTALIPILVKAIQEQNALIEALTARIAVLEG